MRNGSYRPASKGLGVNCLMAPPRIVSFFCVSFNSCVRFLYPLVADRQSQSQILLRICTTRYFGIRVDVLPPLIVKSNVFTFFVRSVGSAWCDDSHVLTQSGENVDVGVWRIIRGINTVCVADYSALFL